MRLQTIISAAMLLALAGCSSNDDTLVYGQPGHPDYPHGFNYGSTVDAPTIEHVISFEEGNATISQEAKERLTPHVKHLISKPWVKVNVQGNSSKPGSVNGNYELGLKRAAAVKEYFLAEGVDESQVMISSVGEMKVPGFSSMTVVLSY